MTFSQRKKLQSQWQWYFHELSINILIQLFNVSSCDIKMDLSENFLNFICSAWETKRNDQQFISIETTDSKQKHWKYTLYYRHRAEQQQMRNVLKAINYMPAEKRCASSEETFIPQIVHDPDNNFARYSFTLQIRSLMPKITELSSTVYC